MTLLNRHTKLAELRSARGLLQKDVALAAGVSRVFVTQVENGYRIPSMQIAKRWADSLGVTLDEFFDALGVTLRNNEQAAASMP